MAITAPVNTEKNPGLLEWGMIPRCNGTNVRSYRVLAHSIVLLVCCTLFTTVDCCEGRVFSSPFMVGNTVQAACGWVSVLLPIVVWCLERCLY